MTEVKELHDSGERRKFTSGAVRDRGGRKPRPDLISPHAQMREGMIMTLGGEKYDLRNWEKGMEISECLASAQRHIEQYKRGDTDEDHMAQARWNLGVILHYEEEIKAGRMDPAIDDMPKYAQQLRKYIDEGENISVGGLVHELDFCAACGASIPSRFGEATCPQCNSEATYILDYSRLLSRPTPTFYVTGPMRGLPFFNFPAFDGARDLGISLGYNIISPADLDRKKGIDPINDPGCVERMKEENPDLLQDIVRRDIEAVLNLNSRNNDGLAILPDWRKSTGAPAEIYVARFKGLRLVDARDFKTIIEV